MERPGFLRMAGYAGDRLQPVTVVGETPKRYRIRADGKKIRLAGRDRWLLPGETALVPKTAVSVRSDGSGPT